MTVLDSSGELLASGQGKDASSAGEMAGLETLVSDRIQENIRKTLTPYLGLPNFQVSVAATLNTDKERVAQTIFDPDSRIERSIQDRSFKRKRAECQFSTPDHGGTEST